MHRASGDEDPSRDIKRDIRIQLVKLSINPFCKQLKARGNELINNIKRTAIFQSPQGAFKCISIFLHGLIEIW